MLGLSFSLTTKTTIVVVLLRVGRSCTNCNRWLWPLLLVNVIVIDSSNDDDDDDTSCTTFGCYYSN